MSPCAFDGASWDHVITLEVWCADVDDDDDASAPSRSGRGAANASASASTGRPRRRRRLQEVGGSPAELARFITPFRRQVGRWVTDVTPLMPMLYHDACNFTAEVTSGHGWAATASLRFSGALAHGAATPAAIAPLVWPNNANDEFDSVARYNANRTLRFAVPEGATKVVLEAIVSGHGDCEATPTAHHWYFNGARAQAGVYKGEFLGAGTMWGCSDKALQGSEPNEHGTWNYGRDGWCDGSPVRPLTFDVTSSVTLDPDATNNVTYFALSWASDDDARFDASIHHEYTAPATATDGCGGYILMSSNLVFYS